MDRFMYMFVQFLINMSLLRICAVNIIIMLFFIFYLLSKLSVIFNRMPLRLADFKNIVMVIVISGVFKQKFIHIKANNKCKNSRTKNSPAYQNFKYWDRRKWISNDIIMFISKYIYLY